LIGYLREFGADPRPCGVVSDDPADIAAIIRDTIGMSDMLITTGGASVGDYDGMLEALELLGAEVLFWKTAMKPGGSILAAIWQDRLILGLSGNPGAALLGLFRIGLPYIRKLCGRTNLLQPTVEVVLRQPLTKKSPQLRLLRGHLAIDGGTAWFVENAGQGNGIVSSFVGCDLLGEIPAGSPPLPAGTRIKAWRIRE
jgi:molybdopterin molybdotransferase